MRIDSLLKAAFAREVEKNCSALPPFPAFDPIDWERNTVAIEKNRRSHGMEIGLAACFIIVFGVSIFLKDGVLRSPLANQGASIARLFPENPKAALYEFIGALNSSF
jgi:hypothetical protein